MRKRMITQCIQVVIPPEQIWPDLEYLAEVELTSEDASHPIKAA
jgi:hypothetical protein